MPQGAFVKANEVFTPGSLPTYTYYERPKLDLEQQLLSAVETKGIIASVSGPSKSGKTVLCANVIGKSPMVMVTGGGVASETACWNKVRTRLGLPTTPSSTTTAARFHEIESRAAISESSGGNGHASSSIVPENGRNNGHHEPNGGTPTYAGPDGVELLEYLRDQNKMLVIDDFHYIPREVQRPLVEQFKEGARAGCTIVVVSVPHRSDDCIRANPDLRGRLICIDVPYWESDELGTIPKTGLPLLDLHAEESLVELLVSESVSSPQLMQALCLQLCRDIGVDDGVRRKRQIELSIDQIKALFRNTTAFANCKTAFDIILAGPKPRGSGRSLYHLADGSTGDIYHVILRALTSDQPLLTLSYAEMKKRIEMLVPTYPPAGMAITSSIEQMHKSVVEKLGEDRVLEWDEEKQALNLPDPYFLYYLRWKRWD
jgi:hypothetical protein